MFNLHEGDETRTWGLKNILTKSPTPQTTTFPKYQTDTQLGKEHLIHYTTQGFIIVLQLANGPYPKSIQSNPESTCFKSNLNILLPSLSSQNNVKASLEEQKTTLTVKVQDDTQTYMNQWFLFLLPYAIPKYCLYSWATYFFWKLYWNTREYILMPGITLTGTNASANQNLSWQVIQVGWQQHATNFHFSLTDIFNKTQLLPRKVQKISEVLRTTGG